MPKSEIEYTDANDAVRKFQEELRRLGLLERFISNAIGFMEAEPLRRLERSIRNRIGDLESMRLQAWDEASIEKYLAQLAPDALRFLWFLVAPGSLHGDEGAIKKTVMKHFHWGSMKVAGVIAGLTRIAKSMDRKPLVERTWIRTGEDWDVLYKISEENNLELTRCLLKQRMT